MRTARGEQSDTVAERDIVERAARAWNLLRRPLPGPIRDQLYGTGAEVIEAGQMDALEILADGSPWRMSDLATALGVEPSTGTHAVQRLVDAGLAQRASTRRDGRVVHVVITPAGLARAAAGQQRRSELFGAVLGALPADQRAALARLLERLVGELDAHAAHAAHTAHTEPEPERLSASS